MRFTLRFFSLFVAAVTMLIANPPAFADGNLHNVKHIIVIMQENHSFDNYFGAWLTRRAAGTTTAETAVAPTTMVV